MLNPADFVFDVQRSGSPGFRSEDDFDVLVEGRVGILEYEDLSINLRDHFRTYYYRVVARSIADERVSFVSHVIRFNMRPTDRRDLILREIRHRHGTLLARYTGVPCAIFLAKSYGPRCNVCYNEILGRCSDGKCTACYRTTFLGGYYLPIGRWVQFAPPPKRSTLELHGKEHRTFTSAMLEHDPVLKPGDIIKDLQSGEVWDVAAMEPSTAKLGNIGHQTAVLYRLDRDDVEHSLASSVEQDSLCDLEFRAITDGLTLQRK
jgi:hypothetical protein